MPKHIFIAGVPASGKTTEAHRLERRIGIPVIHGDTLRVLGKKKPGTEELRAAIKKLKDPHIIEGVQVMGLRPEEVLGHDVRVIEPSKRAIIGRLMRRGFKTHHAARYDREGAEKLYEEMAQNLAEFKARIGKISMGEKNAALYHGSPLLLEELAPRDDHGDTDIAKAVFATPSRTFALAYTGKKWGDRDISQSTRGGGKTPWRMTLREMRPDAIKDIFGTSGYLYQLPEETFTGTTRRTRMEVTSPTAVVPLKTQLIKDVLRALKRRKDVELLLYDPTHYGTKSAVRFSIKRMREMDSKGQQQYRDWRMETATPEIKALWEKLEKQGTYNMTPFMGGFHEELKKLAFKLPKPSPKTMAWAFSRGVTNGAAAALTALTMLHLAKRQRETNSSSAADVLPAAGLGVMTGLGKGMGESLLEQRMLRAFK